MTPSKFSMVMTSCQAVSKRDPVVELPTSITNAGKLKFHAVQLSLLSTVFNGFYHSDVVGGSRSSSLHWPLHWIDTSTVISDFVCVAFLHRQQQQQFFSFFHCIINPSYSQTDHFWEEERILLLVIEKKQETIRNKHNEYNKNNHKT